MMKPLACQPHRGEVGPQQGGGWGGSSGAQRSADPGMTWGLPQSPRHPPRLGPAKRKCVFGCHAQSHHSAASSCRRQAHGAPPLPAGLPPASAAAPRSPGSEGPALRLGQPQAQIPRWWLQDLAPGPSCCPCLGEWGSPGRGEPSSLAPQPTHFRRRPLEARGPQHSRSRTRGLTGWGAPLGFCSRQLGAGGLSVSEGRVFRG